MQKQQEIILGLPQEVAQKMLNFCENLPYKTAKPLIDVLINLKPIEKAKAKAKAKEAKKKCKK